MRRVGVAAVPLSAPARIAAVLADVPVAVIVVGMQPVSTTNSTVPTPQALVPAVLILAGAVAGKAERVGERRLQARARRGAHVIVSAVARPVPVTDEPRIHGCARARPMHRRSSVRVELLLESEAVEGRRRPMGCSAGFGGVRAAGTQDVPRGAHL